MGASIPLRRVTCYFLPVASSQLRWLLHREQIGLHYSAPAALLRWRVFPLQFAEQWTGSVRAPQASRKCLSPAGPCHCKLPLLCITGLLPTVCVLLGEVFSCLAAGSGFTADCTWKQLFNSFSASLMLYSLITTPCSSATCMLHWPGQENLLWSTFPVLVMCFCREWITRVFIGRYSLWLWSLSQKLTEMCHWDKIKIYSWAHQVHPISKGSSVLASRLRTAK